MFLAMRLELWLACVLAYYELASGQALHRSSGHRAGGVLRAAAACYRCVTAANRLRHGSGSFWCYTRRLVYCSCFSTHLIGPSLAADKGP